MDEESLAAVTEAGRGSSAALAAAAARAREAPDSCAVVLVEGMSDQAALETLAVEAQGELGPFHTFTRQPAQRNRTHEQQLRRFMGTRSGRKIHYGHMLAAALELTRLPGPLDGVLSRV